MARENLILTAAKEICDTLLKETSRKGAPPSVKSEPLPWRQARFLSGHNKLGHACFAGMGRDVLGQYLQRTHGAELRLHR
jgi:hypothetical protein